MALLELGGMGYDSVLISLGFAAYCWRLSFCNRDLPAPL